MHGPWPEFFRWVGVMLLSLFYPLLLGMCLAALVCWLVPGWWKISILLILPVVVGMVFYVLGVLVPVVLHLPVASVDKVRVAQLNVLMVGDELDAKLRFIRESGAEVVSLIEVSAPLDERLAELADVYPFMEKGPWLPTRRRTDYRIVLLSKYKLEKVTELAPEMIVYRVLAERPYFVAQVHPAAPYTIGMWQRRAAELELLARTALPQPLMMVGDFNTVPWDGGVREVARAHGVNVAGAWGPTFPRGLPLTPIDLLLIPQSAQSKLWRVRVPGTDHVGFVADVGL